MLFIMYTEQVSAPTGHRELQLPQIQILQSKCNLFSYYLLFLLYIYTLETVPSKYTSTTRKTRLHLTLGTITRSREIYKKTKYVFHKKYNKEVYLDYTFHNNLILLGVFYVSIEQIIKFYLRMKCAIGQNPDYLNKNTFLVLKVCTTN